jgi:hypothetical protein
MIKFDGEKFSIPSEVTGNEELKKVVEMGCWAKANYPINYKDPTVITTGLVVKTRKFFGSLNFVWLMSKLPVNDDSLEIIEEVKYWLKGEEHIETLMSAQDIIARLCEDVFSYAALEQWPMVTEDEIELIQDYYLHLLGYTNQQDTFHEGNITK